MQADLGARGIRVAIRQVEFGRFLAEARAPVKQFDMLVAGVPGEAWLALQAALARELPVAWIYHSRGIQAISARLHGVRMDLRGELATVTRWSVDRMVPPASLSSSP